MKVYAVCAFTWLLGIEVASLPADAPAGGDLFARRCSGCHSLDINKEGPRLRGVAGRKAGSVPEFPYSNALRNSGIVWKDDLLNKWLEDPDQLVPENNMEFRVPNAVERAALIEYLKSL
jgi:cytochrome c